MKIEMLVSAVNQDVRALAKRMNIRTGAVIINQCGEFGYEEYRHNSHTIRCYSLKERGRGPFAQQCINARRRGNRSIFG